MDPDTDVCQTEQPQISYSVDFTAEQSSAMGSPILLDREGSDGTPLSYVTIWDMLTAQWQKCCNKHRWGSCHQHPVTRTRTVRTVHTGAHYRIGLNVMGRHYDQTGVAILTRLQHTEAFSRQPWPEPSTISLNLSTSRGLGCATLGVKLRLAYGLQSI